MKRYSRMLRYFPFTHTRKIMLLLVTFVCAMALFGCGDDTTTYENPTPTLGSLNVSVNPASATVVVTGPGSFTQTFIGNQLLADLEPGQYTAEATATGFIDAFNEINVVAGQTSSISLVLNTTAIISEAPRAVYRDDQGNLIPIDSSVMNSDRFVFYAWLEDETSGILTSNLTTTPVSDPGEPSLDEQNESAPSLTQNLACAWIGFKDATGVVRPVIGADVRWEIDQYWASRIGSMQFGTSDDNSVASEYGIFDDQADTRTNNAHLDAERFPYIVSKYPLYNQTGISSPYTDGFTWVTLFSPDNIASGRIVAVATVNGEEIGKQILFKNFAPAPEIAITKTVSADVVSLVGGTATVTWTVTVENVGDGDATKVDIVDILASGAGASYTLGSLPGGSTAVGAGFTHSFPLGATVTETLTFDATVTKPGTYCNEVGVNSYSSESNTWNPVALNARACFTAIESDVSIIKDFVAADGTTSLGKSLTVAANEPARLRVRVINNGTGDATGVEVNDVLTSGDGAAYALSGTLPGTANASDGFVTTPASLAAGATKTLLFTAAASVDGIYCDTATVIATSGTITIGSDQACLTVATPNLTITKVDAPENVLPGNTYTSTIVVKNDGTATARDVVISDTLGLNSIGDVRAIYVSSNLTGASGTLANSVVTAPMVDIVAGESLTFTVMSRIPLAASSGEYCNTATVMSSNAATEEASDCIIVPAFSALQVQLVDLNDPAAIGSNVTYFSVQYVEALSNEGVGQEKLTYSFGLSSSTVLGIPGVFQIVSTKVYLDTHPVRDPVTGLILSDTANPTAALLTEGTDYTVDNSTPGLQVLTMTPSVILQPDTARYVVHEVLVPSGTPTNHLYTTSYIWNSVGLVNPSNTYEASASEPTTVLP